MKKKWLAVLLLTIMGLAIGGIGYSVVFGSPKTLDDIVMRFVSGTEYAYGEDGSTIVRVTNRYGIGVTAYECNDTVYYPNKTAWKTDEAMAQGGATGSWYLDWNAPSIEGIYEQYVACLVPVGGVNRTLANSKSFHVSSTYTNLTNDEVPSAVVIS